MDAQTFELKVGRAPVQDDLDRVNCKQAGELMHSNCGWCDKCDRPHFQCLHEAHSPRVQKIADMIYASDLITGAGSDIRAECYLLARRIVHEVTTNAPAK